MGTEGMGGGGGPMREYIELVVTSPASPLKGVRDAQQRVDALTASIKALQSQLSGLSTHAVFKLSPQQYARKAWTAEGKPLLGVGQVARAIGFSPDTVKDIRRTADMITAEVHRAIGMVQKELGNPAHGARARKKLEDQITTLRNWLPFSNVKSDSFSSAIQAGKFFGGGLLADLPKMPKGFSFPKPIRDILERGYAGVAMQNVVKGERALAWMLNGGVPVNAPAAPTNLAEAVRKPKPRPAPAAEADAGEPTPTPTRRKSKPGKSATGESATTLVAKPKPAGLVDIKRVRYSDGRSEKVTLIQQTGPDQTVETTTQGDESRQTTRTRVTKKLGRKLDLSLNQLANEYAVMLGTGPSGQAYSSVMKAAGLMYKSNPQYALLGMKDRMVEFSQQLRDKKAAYDKWHLAQEARADAGRRNARLGRSEDEERAALAMEDARINTRQQRQAQRADRMLSRFLTRNQKHAMAEYDEEVAGQHRLKRQTDVQAYEAALVRRGARWVSDESDPLTKRLGKRTYEFESDGRSYTAKLNYGAAGGAVAKLTERTRELRKETELLGGDFVKNTLKVTAWSASVGLLYQSFGLVQSSFASLVDNGYKMARLDQVFRQVGGTTRELSFDTMHLAAINGRSTREAMDAAIQWSRLGLTRMQVNEAVRVSLMAANVAEMTAAESTEHLQTVMQNYGLKVYQLGSVLGELNQISNTFNVTNRDLMEGLSRSAAVAKQAGLPLEELMGIIGAPVGTTGQSGANIGNAVKSVMLGLSNPALQDKLRSTYQFETTKGGEDLKSMSQILADLYVRYMKLNQAQQQSMLFSVAGRTQANRLAAMMDSYVQAQVLAVNAQLNLNSAEAENAKITATLRAQFAGLTAEWEKFVMIQGSGPADSLLYISKVMRDVLTLVNMPGMRAVTGWLLGLGAIGLGRSMMAAISVRNAAGQGFVGKSGAAVMREAGALSLAASGAIESVHARSLQRSQQRVEVENERRDKYYMRLRGQGLSAGDANAQVLSMYGHYGTPQGGLFSRGLKTVDSWGTVRMAAGVAQFNMSGLLGAHKVLGSLNVALGSLAKTASMAALAFSEFAVPLAIIYGATKAFDWAMEHFGQSIEGATKRLDDNLKEQEKHRAAGNAYGEAANAMSTFSAALTPDRFGRMRPDDVAALTGRLPDLMHLGETDLKKRDALQKASREELDRMRQAGDMEGVLVTLDKARFEYVALRNRELQNGYELGRKTLQIADEEISRLQRMNELGMRGRSGRDARIAELKLRRNEQQHQNIKSIMEQDGNLAQAWDEYLRYKVSHMSAVARVEEGVGAIGNVYGDIGTSNPMERAYVDMARIDAQTKALKSHIKLLDDQGKSDDTARQGKISAKTDISTELEQTRKDLAEINKPIEIAKQLIGTGPYTESEKNLLMGANFGSYPGPLPDGVSEKYRNMDFGKMFERHSQLQIHADELQNKLNTFNPAEAGEGMLGVQSRAKQRELDVQRLKELEAGSAAKKSTLPLYMQHTLFGFGQARAEHGAASHRYGIDETDRMLNERAAVERDMAGLEGRQNLTITERGQLIRDQNLLYANTLALRQRHAGIEAEIRQLAIDQNREFSRSFFGSGPGDMLRKLAAFRMAMRGPVSQGQLYGLNPDMRNDVGMLTGQNPQMMLLQNERNRLNAGIRGIIGSISNVAEGLDAAQLSISERLKRALDGMDRSLVEAFDKGINTALSDATENLGKLNSALSKATDATNTATDATLDFVAALRSIGGGGPGGIRFKLPGRIGGGWSPGMTERSGW